MKTDSIKKEKSMKKIPFDTKELTVVKEETDRRGTKTPIYNHPITMRENYLRTILEKDPVWIPLGVDTTAFCPSVIPDNHARAYVIEANMVPPCEDGYVKDMFGVEWRYVPEAGGSMERTDVPHLMEDVNDWEKVIKFPDVDSWDWEASSEANRGYLGKDKANLAWEINGWWFERLISFMGFENAVMALIDDDQKSAVHALFEKTTDLGCRIIDKVVEYYDDVDGFTVHDDWGSQRNPFFSFDTAQEMIVPYMKKLTDHIHSKGLVADLHSCGATHKRTQCFIDAGWDSWRPQPMNDTLAMFDEFGDKICLGVVPEKYDPEKTTADEQRELGIAFARRICVPGKTAFVSLSAAPMMTDAFREGCYKESRILYSK